MLSLISRLCSGNGSSTRSKKKIKRGRAPSNEFHTDNLSTRSSKKEKASGKDGVVEQEVMDRGDSNDEEEEEEDEKQEGFFEIDTNRSSQELSAWHDVKSPTSLSLYTSSVFAFTPNQKKKKVLVQFNTTTRAMSKKIFESTHNTRDPITLETLNLDDPQRIFINSKKQVFDLITLVFYLSSTRQFVDPVTTIEFSEEKIKEMDDKYQSLRRKGLLIPVKSSSEGEKEENGNDMEPLPDIQLYESYLARHEENTDWSSEKKSKKQVFENRTTLNVILDGLIAEVYDALLKDASASGPVQDMDLKLAIIFSEFESPFLQLKTIDTDFANATILSYKNFLEGPSKKPTEDPHDRLPTILARLDGMVSEAERASIEEKRSRSFSCDF